MGKGRLRDIENMEFKESINSGIAVNDKEYELIDSLAKSNGVTKNKLLRGIIEYLNDMEMEELKAFKKSHGNTKNVYFRIPGEDFVELHQKLGKINYSLVEAIRKFLRIHENGDINLSFSADDED